MKIRLVLPAAFLLSLLSATMAAPGCATVARFLPIVTAYAQDGALILDQVDRFVDAIFVAHPNPEAQRKIEVVEARVRSALMLALRIAEGTSDLNQAKIDEAFLEYRQAWAELMALVGPLGVSQAAAGGSLAAGPGRLVVPEPLGVRRR